MRELKASTATVVALQLGGVWSLGAVGLPTVRGALLIAAFGGAGTFGVVALVSLTAVLAYLMVVIGATRAVSHLGATGGRRVLWALLVLVGGTAGWALGWAVTDVAGLGVSRDPQLTFLLGGVPFALVAGLLLRLPRINAVALALAVLLAGAGVAVLRHEWPDEFEERLAANQVSRETAFAVAIPGYLPNDNLDYGNGLGGGGFRVADPDGVPTDRYVTITVHDRVGASESMCGQPTAEESRLRWGGCTVEPDGLVYRHNEIEHGYQVPVGRRYVTVVGTPAVERDLLRTAASSLRPATAEELSGTQQLADRIYAATVPGYRGQAAGIPPGMVYAPADHTGNGSQSVAISLYVAYADGDSICFRTAECVPDGDGLTYIRTEDAHGYVVRRDRVNVRVLGGLRVDRSLLRRAVQDARPATDEELRRALPPVEPREPIDHLRRWLRAA